MKNVLLIVCLFSGITAHAQNPEDSVRQPIKQLFAAMLESDSVGVANAFTNSAQLQTIVNKQGEISVQKVPIEKFAQSVSKAPKGSLQEEISFGTLEIHGDLATCTTPYQFYYNKKLLHGGVNHFVLVKTTLGWKIQFIIDTRIKA